MSSSSKNPTVKRNTRVTPDLSDVVSVNEKFVVLWFTDTDATQRLYPVSLGNCMFKKYSMKERACFKQVSNDCTITAS